MLHHHRAPPPLPPGSSPWEASAVAAVTPTVQAIARRVRGLETCDQDQDDAVQRMLLEVILACRRWAATRGPGCPDSDYIWAAVHRAKGKLYRSVRRSGHRATIRPGDGNESDPVCVTPCTGPTPAEVSEQARAQQSYAQVAAGVYALFPASDVALLRMAADGMTPAAIAHSVGRPGDNVAVSQRLYVLRRRAREHLAGLGIRALDDASFVGTHDALDR